MLMVVVVRPTRNFHIRSIPTANYLTCLCQTELEYAREGLQHTRADNRFEVT